MTTWSSLTLIASALTGEGDLAFTNEYQGLVVLATSVPPFETGEAGTPAYYRRLGWIAFETDGYHEDRHQLHYLNAQVTDIPPLVDHVHYKLDLDVVASIYGAKGGLNVDDIYRTFSHIVKEYDAIIAPAGVTERWRYTVPAGSVARVVSGQVFLNRITAAAPVGNCYAWLNLNGATGLLNGILLNNGVGAQQGWFTNLDLLLTAGQYLSGNTLDLSTGGTVQHHVSIIAREMTL